MRNIELAASFKRDLRRLSGGIYRRLIVRPDGEVWQVADALTEDKQLPPKYRDHMLQGEWEGSRDCHIRPDLVLVYTYVGKYILRLERLESHAKIFGM